MIGIWNNGMAEYDGVPYECVMYVIHTGKSYTFIKISQHL